MEMQTQTQTLTCAQAPLTVHTVAVVTEQMMELFSGAGHSLGGSGMHAALQQLMAIIRQHLQDTFTPEKWKLIWEVLLQQLVDDGHDINTGEGQRRLTNMAIVVMTRNVQARLTQELQNQTLSQGEIVYLHQLVASLNASIAAQSGRTRGTMTQVNPQHPSQNVPADSLTECSCSNGSHRPPSAMAQSSGPQFVIWASQIVSQIGSSVSDLNQRQHW